jgi:hypothetical protein
LAASVGDLLPSQCQVDCVISLLNLKSVMGVSCVMYGCVSGAAAGDTSALRTVSAAAVGYLIKGWWPAGVRLMVDNW